MPDLCKPRNLSQEMCNHSHSITGDFAVVKRLLPEYVGGHPQAGYMLDVCKECLTELPERPYNMVWPLRRRQLPRSSY